MEKKKKLKISREVLKQLRDAELSQVVGGLTACTQNTGAECCTAAGVLTSCASKVETDCCQLPG